MRVTEDSDNSLHAMDSWLHRCIEEFGRGVSCGRGVPPYGNPMVIDQGIDGKALMFNLF